MPPKRISNKAEDEKTPPLGSSLQQSLPPDDPADDQEADTAHDSGDEMNDKASESANTSELGEETRADVGILQTSEKSTQTSDKLTQTSDKSVQTKSTDEKEPPSCASADNSGSSEDESHAPLFPDGRSLVDYVVGLNVHLLQTAGSGPSALSPSQVPGSGTHETEGTRMTEALAEKNQPPNVSEEEEFRPESALLIALIELARAAMDERVSVVDPNSSNPPTTRQSNIPVGFNVLAVPHEMVDTNLSSEVIKSFDSQLSSEDNEAVDSNTSFETNAEVVPNPPTGENEPSPKLKNGTYGPNGADNPNPPIAHGVIYDQPGTQNSCKVVVFSDISSEKEPEQPNVPVDPHLPGDEPLKDDDPNDFLPLMEEHSTERGHYPLRLLTVHSQPQNAEADNRQSDEDESSSVEYAVLESDDEMKNELSEEELDSMSVTMEDYTEENVGEENKFLVRDGSQLDNQGQNAIAGLDGLKSFEPKGSDSKSKESKSPEKSDSKSTGSKSPEPEGSDSKSDRTKSPESKGSGSRSKGSKSPEDSASKSDGSKSPRHEGSDSKSEGSKSPEDSASKSDGSKSPGHEGSDSRSEGSKSPEDSDSKSDGSKSPEHKGSDSRSEGSKSPESSDSKSDGSKSPEHESSDSKSDGTKSPEPIVCSVDPKIHEAIADPLAPDVVVDPEQPEAIVAPQVPEPIADPLAPDAMVDPEQPDAEQPEGPRVPEAVVGCRVHEAFVSLQIHQPHAQVFLQAADHIRNLLVPGRPRRRINYQRGPGPFLLEEPKESIADPDDDSSEAPSPPRPDPLPVPRIKVRRHDPIPVQDDSSEAPSPPRPDPRPEPQTQVRRHGAIPVEDYFSDAPSPPRPDPRPEPQIQVRRHDVIPVEDMIIRFNVEDDRGAERFNPTVPYDAANIRYVLVPMAAPDNQGILVPYVHPGRRRIFVHLESITFRHSEFVTTNVAMCERYSLLQDLTDGWARRTVDFGGPFRTYLDHCTAVYFEMAERKDPRLSNAAYQLRMIGDTLTDCDMIIHRNRYIFEYVASYSDWIKDMYQNYVFTGRNIEAYNFFPERFEELNEYLDRAQANMFLYRNNAETFNEFKTVLEPLFGAPQ